MQLLLRLFLAVLAVLGFGVQGAKPAEYHKPTLIWLQPLSQGLNVSGVQITGGVRYALMSHIAHRMPQFEHAFESYPLKRNFFLVQHKHSEQQVYCFFGAYKTAEREQWGHFSHPTTVILPNPVISKRGALDEYLFDGYVSLEEMFADGRRTVSFDGVDTLLTKTINKHDLNKENVFKMGTGQRDRESLTMDLLKNDRIDFAFVGWRKAEIGQMEKKHQFAVSVYNLRETKGNVRKGSRALCSKSALGERAVFAINRAIETTLSAKKTNQQFRDLNFQAIGYPPQLKAQFDTHWSALFQPN